MIAWVEGGISSECRRLGGLLPPAGDPLVGVESSFLGDRGASIRRVFLEISHITLGWEFCRWRHFFSFVD